MGAAADFTELDRNDLGRLELLDGLLGEQASGTIAGVTSHRLDYQRDPGRRVWLAGGPSRTMGQSPRLSAGGPSPPSTTPSNTE